MVKLSSSSASRVKQAILEVLADSKPKPLPRMALQIAVQERLGFRFSPASFRGMLNDFIESGVLRTFSTWVEAQHFFMDSTMLKNDKWITEQSRKGMIVPHCEALCRTVVTASATENGILTQSHKAISYGLSSYGYDLRLSPEDFRIFRKVPGEIADPKDFSPLHLSSAKLVHDREKGDYFILPAHSYGLGVAIECLTIPDNITVICMGKSTYARMGVIANLTPFESGWRGHPTLEFSNSSGADCRIYANEGVVQMLFLEGEPCETTYRDRGGKYQGQGPEVTLAKL